MLLAAFVGLVTIVTTLLFTTRRFWFPNAISAHGAAFDAWFLVVAAVLGFVFFAAQFALAWMVWSNRARGQKAAHSQGVPRLEVLWTSLTAVLFLGASLYGARLWTGSQPDAAPGMLRIETLAKQFAWNFRYPGPDGRFGQTSIQFVNDANGNPFGVDERDPASNDDVTTAALRVPAGRLVELRLRSQDVIHDFFVRELRVKQDIVPGMDIPLRFIAEIPGHYEIACSELCGLGHHQMRSVLMVMPPVEFDKWLQSQKR